MAFKLDNVVPWGRSFDEYTAMFRLSEEDLQQHILGCSDGPASFNAALTARGGSVVSADPLYALEGEAIAARIAATFSKVLDETRRNRESFMWDSIASVETLGEVRMVAMETFLADFEEGKTEGRYQAAALPSLPFANQEFGLALCAHFLFLYSDQHDLQFHLASIEELCRVAREVRVFPLLTLAAQCSPHLPAVLAHLRETGHTAEVLRVPYEFQRGGNEMLRVAK